jgi:DtxR family Mn-dependent transcriptional regulator
MSQEQVTVAEEEYLQIIYWLQEAGLPITGANIARAMQVSAPTVHEMIGRLEADGYVTRGADKSLEFTDSGQEHAAGIVRRHRLIERFLTDVFDIPWDQVHEEAERLEHWMSPVVEERMLRAIGDAKTCPHGHPIFEGEREHGVPLADVEEGARVRVLRSRGNPRAVGRRRGRGRCERLDPLGHAQRRRDRLSGGRPLAAAAHRPPGPAGAGPRALRPLTRQ